jgi:hypothetical protein
LLTNVLDRFEALIKNRTLIIDCESGFKNVVETKSGKTAESYVIAYPSARNLEKGLNGLAVADSIFYDPDKKEISCGFEVYSFWDRFSDEEEDVINAWGLADVLENQPPQLDGAKSSQKGGLQGLKLTEYLFNLYRSHLEAKRHGGGHVAV